jgi:hypothetical protein
MTQEVSQNIIWQRRLRNCSPLQTIKISDLPSPSVLSSDQLLLPILTKKGELLVNNRENNNSRSKKL